MEFHRFVFYHTFSVWGNLFVRSGDYELTNTWRSYVIVLSDYCQEIAVSLYVKYTFEVVFSTRHRAQGWFLLLQQQIGNDSFSSTIYKAYRFEESWRWLTHWFQGKYLIMCLIIWCSCATRGEVFDSYYYWLVFLLLVGVFYSFGFIIRFVLHGG